VVGVTCHVRETWAPDSPAPLSGPAQLTELPGVFFPYFTDVGNSTTGRKACCENRKK